ncbi:hypothetical protein [Streptomyces sp. NPDC006309]
MTEDAGRGAEGVGNGEDAEDAGRIGRSRAVVSDAASAGAPP